MRFEDLSILVVDDSKPDREALRRLLRDLGAGRVRTAPNGSRALRIASRTSFDLVLCDPGDDPVTGLRTIACLRQLGAPGGEHLPVVVLTAHAGRDLLVRAVEEGVQGYLLKPVSIATLSERIAQILDGAAPRRADR